MAMASQTPTRQHPRPSCFMSEDPPGLGEAGAQRAPGHNEGHSQNQAVPAGPPCLSRVQQPGCCSERAWLAGHCLGVLALGWGFSGSPLWGEQAPKGLLASSDVATLLWGGQVTTFCKEGFCLSPCILGQAWCPCVGVFHAEGDSPSHPGHPGWRP